MEANDCLDEGSDVSNNGASAAGQDEGIPTARKARGRRTKGLRRSPKSARRSKPEKRSNSDSNGGDSASPPPAGSFGRASGLLVAALRVWELKWGIRD
jgi:hypothetical protein